MKKILIFIIESGGGHVSAAQAIQDYLQTNYQIKIVSLFKEVISGFDPISFFTFQRFTLDDWYNFFVRKKYNRLINLVSQISVLVYPIYSFFIKNRIFKYIQKENPDLVISVIPIINSSIGFATQKLSIPFIIVTTDLDTRWFTKYLSGKAYKNFNFTVAFDDKMIWKTLDTAHLSKDTIKITGFPIRKSFFEPKDSSAIKKEFKIPENKPVFMILMGGVGSDLIINYLQEIKKITFPLHLIVCLGKNEQLTSAIKNIFLPEQITISIVGFTNKIADLMVVSDILLTKPGSVSVCEGIYMNVPMLLDATSKLLDWEKFNLSFVKEHGFGQIITSYSQVVHLLEKCFENQEYQREMKMNLSQYKKDNFGKNIGIIVQKIL